MDGIEDIPGLNYMYGPLEEWQDAAKERVAAINKELEKEAKKEKNIKLGLDVTDAQKTIDTLFGTAEETFKKIRKNKKNQSLLDGEKIKKETKEIGAAVQKMAEDSKKAWDSFVTDFQKSTEKLPKDLKNSVEKLLQIVSPKNFLNTKKEIENNKNVQIKAIEEVTTKKEGANEAEKAHRTAVNEFLFNAQIRLSDALLSDYERKQVQELRSLE